MQLTYVKEIDNEEAMSFLEIIKKRGLQWLDIRWEAKTGRLSVGLPFRINGERDFFEQVRMFTHPAGSTCPKCGQEAQ